MTANPKSFSDVSEYTLEISVSKSAGGSMPITTQAYQVSSLVGSVDTLDSVTVDTERGNINFASFAQSVEIYWALNSLPLVRVTFVPPQDLFLILVSFPGFLKNNVIGVRVGKPKLSQESPWIYGTIQYAVPKMNGADKSIVVEGHGLLFEAARRVTSRSYKNLTAKNIIGSIIGKYGLNLVTTDLDSDRFVNEKDQNIDDLSFINQMAGILQAHWFIQDRDFVLVSRDRMYGRTPEITLSDLSKVPENFASFFPLSDFVPEPSDDAFEAGADKLTARGIDLDSKSVVEQVFRPSVRRMGTFSLNSDRFLTKDGVSINKQLLNTAPEFQPFESGVFLPLRSRSDEMALYQNAVDAKDVEIRATATLPGIPLLTPGMVVSVQGVGDIFSGNYFVEAVSHVVHRLTGFMTVLTLGRNAVGQFANSTGFEINVKNTPDKQVGGVIVQAESV